VSQVDGIGRRMPWTMAAFTIGALGMIGIPPTAGFLGKWFILTGAMQTANWLAVSVIIVSTLLNAGYFLPIVFRAFFRDPPAGGHGGEAPWPIVLALTATAAGSMLMFFLPGIPYALATLMMGR
jgi:multicomponent Na+:H+ antiporter subunit D